MGIWDKLESVINSYINDYGNQTSRSFKSNRSDPDLDAAYEELDDYLNRRDSRKEQTGYSWKNTEQENSKSAYNSFNAKLPPEELRADFKYLNVPFGADAELCKIEYKKLLKIHHPDRHAGNENNYKKATEISAKLNAAWDRIEKWRRESEPR